MYHHNMVQTNTKPLMLMLLPKIAELSAATLAPLSLELEHDGAAVEGSVGEEWVLHVN
jgi:hypothetical protein